MLAFICLICFLLLFLPSICMCRQQCKIKVIVHNGVLLPCNLFIASKPVIVALLPHVSLSYIPFHFLLEYVIEQPSIVSPVSKYIHHWRHWNLHSFCRPTPLFPWLAAVYNDFNLAGWSWLCLVVHFSLPSTNLPTFQLGLHAKRQKGSSVWVLHSLKSFVI